MERFEGGRIRSDGCSLYGMIGRVACLCAHALSLAYQIF